MCVSEPATFSINWEGKKKNKSYFLKLNESNIASIPNGGIVVEFSNNKSVFGSGVVLGFGDRTYLKKDSWSGFYYDSKLEYGSIKFSEAIYSGTYSYLSLFNGDLGYKWQVFKGLSIDPSIGGLWKLEIKGTGDVDNNIYNNFVPKFGLKVGYSF